MWTLQCEIIDWEGGLRVVCPLSRETHANLVFVAMVTADCLHNLELAGLACSGTLLLGP